MVECKYCNQDIDADGHDVPEYLDHLGEYHPHDVGRIDEQRLRIQWEGDLDEARSVSYRWSALTISVAAASAFFVFGLAVVVLFG
ncbi:hypothetical protein [Haloarcula sp. H-GB5]